MALTGSCPKANIFRELPCTLVLCLKFRIDVTVFLLIVGSAMIEAVLSTVMMSEKPAPPIDTDVSLIEYKTEKKMCSDVLVNCNVKMPGKAALTMRGGLTSQKRAEIRDTGRDAILKLPHPFAVTSDFDGVLFVPIKYFICEHRLHSIPRKPKCEFNKFRESLRRVTRARLKENSLKSMTSDGFTCSGVSARN